MNIAFPALVITLLVLPGILFRYAYRKGLFWKSPVVMGPVTEEIARGLMAALVFHLLGVFVAEHWFRFAFDFDALVVLLTGWPKVDSQFENQVLHAVSRHVYHILFYLISINALALASGYGMHGLVRTLRLDLRYTFLRFSNEWHYLFWGEMRAFYLPLNEIRTLQPPLLTFISALVEEGSEAVLYWGVLSEYYFSSTGELEFIVLDTARRRPLSADRDEPLLDHDEESDERRYYSIRGDYLTIRYSDILNLNVEYFVSSPDNAHEEDTEMALDENGNVSETRFKNWLIVICAFFIIASTIAIFIVDNAGMQRVMAVLSAATTIATVAYVALTYRMVRATHRVVDQQARMYNEQIDRERARRAERFRGLVIAIQSEPIVNNLNERLRDLKQFLLNNESLLDIEANEHFFKTWLISADVDSAASGSGLWNKDRHDELITATETLSVE